MTTLFKFTQQLCATFCMDLSEEDRFVCLPLTPLNEFYLSCL